MSTDNESFLHRWFDQVWNRKNPAAIREMFAEDGTIHGVSGPGGGPIRREEFEQFHRELLEAFPDLHAEVNDFLANENKVAGRFTITGTNTGPWQGSPATGKKVSFTGSGIATVRNGQFVEIWNDVDFLKMQYDRAPDTPDVE